VLDRGADDYLVKPFGPAQLDARIRAVLRRTGADGTGAATALVVGELRVDPTAREATLAGVPLDLTPREFDLLGYLAARPGTVVTKRELLSWLRRKLGETATQPQYLHTVRGVGVKLTAPTP
jgi:DNA-binding response OmpR family regulator